MEEAVQLGQASKILSTFQPSNPAADAQLQIFLSALGSILTVIGLFLPIGAMELATEEEISAAQLQGAIVEAGLLGRRGPGGRAGSGTGNSPAATVVPRSPGQSSLPAVQNPDPDAIESSGNPQSVPNPPDSNGNGGGGGNTPAISIPEEDPSTEPTYIATLSLGAPGILTNMANSSWQEISNAALDPET